MSKFDPARCKTKPFAHQIVGIDKLLNHPHFCIYDEMGAGKSKQFIDAACELYRTGEITIAVVVAPASVKSVWYDEDPELGQIKKHAWIPSRVIELRGTVKKNPWREVWSDGNRSLNWLVVGYEWLRVLPNLNWTLDALFKRKHRTIVAFDESSFIKSRTSQQTKAAEKLAYSTTVSRRVLLNGTPVTQSPMDLWSQMNVCSREILGRKFQNFYHFRNTFCQMGGWENKQIIAYRNLDELQRLIAPYAVRRLKEDCLDLPPKLYTHRDVALSRETWKMYTELKKEALISLGGGDTRIEPNAAVRIVRLAQLTSGLLGGKVQVNLDDPELPLVESLPPDDISDEKLSWCVDYLVNESEADAVIVWCRFRRERERLVERMVNRDHWRVYELYGGERKSLIDEAKLAFSTKSNGSKTVKLLVGQPHAGGLGNSFVAAHEVIYLSQDYSLFWRQQSEDRVHRPGQDSPATYIDCFAVGPQGQKTIDHIIRKALAENEEIARWTCSVWRKKLEAE